MFYNSGTSLVIYLTNQTNSKTSQTIKKQTKMKNITKSLVIAAIAIVSANSSFAQATATASASATIITPITIVKDVDMNFGNVAVSATIAVQLYCLQRAVVPQVVQVVLRFQLLPVLLLLQASQYLARVATHTLSHCQQLLQ